ncbi:MAG: hypothetical protein ACYTG6_17240 [Planctomycetota bacterium]
MNTSHQIGVTYPPLGEVKRLSRVHLDRMYFVYEYEPMVVVKSHERSLTEGVVERRYDTRSVQTLAKYYAGRTVTTEEVLHDVWLGLVQIPVVAYRRRAASQIQDLLICLCAMGLAKTDTSAAEYRYAIGQTTASTDTAGGDGA